MMRACDMLLMLVMFILWQAMPSP